MKEEELQHHMSSNKIDCCLFLNNPNFFYFSRQITPGCLIINDSGKQSLVVSKLDAENLEKKVVWEKGQLFDFLRKKVGKARRIGIDKNYLLVNSLMQLRKSFQKSRFVDVSGFCQKLRLTKTDEELQKLRSASKITEGIYSDCLANFDRFETENDVARFLKISTIENDCELSFEPVVASILSSTPLRISMPPLSLV